MAVIDAATLQRADEIVGALDLKDLDAFADLTDEIAEVLADAGFSSLAQLGVTENGQLVNQVNDRAVRYAAERAAELVSEINGATRDYLRTVISTGLANNNSLKEMVALIEESAAFSEQRATLIARTEIARANSQGALGSYRDAQDVGVKLRKVWLTAEDDLVDEEVCQPNADAGPIDIDALFPSGDDSPPGHPNCRCALSAEVET